MKGKELSNPNKTFQTIKKLIFIAKELEPYLTLYQTDKPMLPFLAANVFNEEIYKG